MLVEKAAAIFQGEDAGEAPLRILEPADVVDVDHQQIAGLGPLDPERPAQIVHLGQVDIPDVIGRVVILDLPAGPVVALDPKLVARLEHFDDGDVGCQRLCVLMVCSSGHLSISARNTVFAMTLSPCGRWM